MAEETGELSVLQSGSIKGSTDWSEESNR